VLNKTPPFQKELEKTVKFSTIAPATVERDRQLLGPDFLTPALTFNPNGRLLL